MQMIDVSATNITGLGAIRLVQSLLPALERHVEIRRLLLPQTSEMSEYVRATEGPPVQRYLRYLPNGLSRVWECTFNSSGIASDLPLLILGDIPVRTRVKQIVLVHQSHIAAGRWTGSGSIRVRMLRALFALNQKFITGVIVQTDLMKSKLEKNYPKLSGRVTVIPQPAPSWLLTSGAVTPPWRSGQQLRLFFPAEPYPHKNHELLERWAKVQADDERSVSLSLTLDKPPKANTETVHYLGRLKPDQMIRQYLATDAIVFPSLEESLGLPLVEAMFLGLPILCADLPYARTLCGDEAVYFDPMDVHSLQLAVAVLTRKLDGGWRPDWSVQLKFIPKDWDEVASRFAALF